MDTQTILGIIVAAVAIYGTILSTLNFRAHHRDRRANIRMKVSTGFAVFGPELSDPQLQLEAVNAGERPVVLSSAGFKLTDGRSIALINPSTKTIPGLPHELLPHRSAMLAENMHDIAGSLLRGDVVGRVKLLGFFRDQENNEYLAKPYEFDINEWLPKAS
jgi:hypothetical protein